jgi:plastocyanin
MKRLAMVLLTGLVLAGCGTSAATYRDPAGMYNEVDSATTFYYPVTATVAIHDNGFSPAALRVPVNTTIDWVNDTRGDRSVTWTGGNEPNFQSGPLAPGQSFEIRMTGDGPVTYRSGKFNGAIQVGYPRRPKL